MDILLILNKLDLECKMFNKDLLEFTLARLEPVYRVKIYTDEKIIPKYVEEKCIKVTNKMEAISKFAEGKEEFIIISRLSLTNINFGGLITYHRNHTKKVTVVAKNFVVNKSIPIYKLDDKKNITAVTRKRFADCGIYLFKKGIDFKKYKNIFTIILDMIDKKEIKGFIHKGYFWTSHNAKRKKNHGTSNKGRGRRHTGNK